MISARGRKVTYSRFSPTPLTGECSRRLYSRARECGKSFFPGAYLQGKAQCCWNRITAYCDPERVRRHMLWYVFAIAITEPACFKKTTCAGSLSPRS